MTTWDIFRLLRNMEKLEWQPENVKPIFYRTGRVEPVPENYKYLGCICNVWEQAVGIIPGLEINKGEKIAIENGDEFDELFAESLKIGDENVEKAPPGSELGIGIASAKEKYKKGMRVFLIIDITT